MLDLNISGGDNFNLNPVVPKLQKIVISKFNGNYLDFQNFRSLFENLLHNRTELNGVQKLFYLKETLIEDASDLVRDFPLEDVAYCPA